MCHLEGRINNQILGLKTQFFLVAVKVLSLEKNNKTLPMENFY